MKRKRLWILLLSAVLCALLALGLHGISGVLKSTLTHEQAANEWDAEGGTAQLSVYFSESEKYTLSESLEQTEFRISNWYHQILNELQSASITTETANPSARLVVYGYSAAGEITLQSESSKVSVKAYGVGGDFFQFHPLKLINGGYFSESDLMQDRVIIDEDTAWQLFGSNDVVGMFVLINKIPHMVVGVYEKDSGYMNDAAGNEKSCVYVSHATLYEYGQYHGLESLEYLIPNPVSGFAKEILQNQVNGMDVAIVEHQNRFDFMSLIGIIGQAGTRSMGLSGITFPYWENIARGYEDILAGILLIELVLLAYAGIVAIGFVWYLWMHRKWRARDIYEKGKDFVYAMRVKRHRNKIKAKGGNES